MSYPNWNASAQLTIWTDSWVVFREALAIQGRLLGEHMVRAETLQLLGDVLRTQGKLQEAEAANREALAMATKLVGEEHPLVAGGFLELGELLLKLGKVAEAETMDRKALDTYRKLDDEDGVAKALSELGLLLAKEGKQAEAETMAREALVMTRTRLGESHPDVMNPLENLASILMHEGKYDEVKELYAGLLAPRASIQATNWQMLVGRGQFFARRAYWKKAAADLSRALELRPDDHGIWHYLAPVLVQEGRLEAYRQHCVKSLARFSKTTDPQTAERIAKDCLILPSSGVDLGEVARLADIAARGPTNDSLFVWIQFTKGLSEYRLGRFGSAAEWMEPVLSQAGDHPDRDLMTQLVLAMAQWQLKRNDSARASLAKGIEIANTKLPKLEEGDLGDSWVDWIIAHALLREAKGLIEGQPIALKDAGR